MAVVTPRAWVERRQPRDCAVLSTVEGCGAGKHDEVGSDVPKLFAVANVHPRTTRHKRGQFHKELCTSCLSGGRKADLARVEQR
jgi:hypothetical protein